MAFRLPNATAKESLSFSARFAALPDELKLMLIGEAVRVPGIIPIRDYAAVRTAATSDFAMDEDLLAMANEQFDKINTFGLEIMSPLAMWPARGVADLRVYFKITCCGGNVNSGFPFSLPAWDTNFLRFIPTLFTRLVSLTVVVHNTGDVANGATYTDHLTIGAIPAAWAPQYTVLERFNKVIGFIDAAEFLILPQWRQGSGIIKKLLFIQCHPNHSRHVWYAPAPIDRSLTHAEVMQALTEIQDAPAALLSYP